MKKVEIIFGILFLIGLTLKIAHLPFGLIMLTISLLALACFYFFNGLKNIFSVKPEEGISMWRFIGSTVVGCILSAVCIGIILRIANLPVGKIVLPIGLIAIFVVIIITLTKYLQSKSDIHKALLLRVAVIGSFGLLFYMFNLSLLITKIHYRDHPDYIKAYEKVLENPKNEEAIENMNIEFIRTISKTQEEFETRLEHFRSANSWMGAIKNFNNENRAKYILGFINQITWPNMETNLTIGILEPDKTFSEALCRYALTEDMNDKKLKVISLRTLENMPSLNLLYVKKYSNPVVKIDSLIYIAQAKGFLLITESAEFHESMINFVILKYSDDIYNYQYNYNVYYEVNEVALQKAGFTYMPILVQIGALNTQIRDHLKKVEMQNMIMVLGFLLIAILVISGIYVYRNYREKRRVNKVLNSQNEEIIRHRDLIANQYKEIARQNKEITDSIIYARRIQNAVLPTPKMLKDYLDMFIIYRPRDIVSGDFYWMSKKEDKLIIVAADCTGHGVPGAFMSMLGIAFLNEIINKEDEIYANEILNKLRDNVIQSLNQSNRMEQEEEYTKDGMDISLCVIDYPNMTLQFAGAYNPLFLIRNKELIVIKADKMPVAYSDFHGKKKFTNNLIPLFHDDCIYMFSDGYTDQFGGNEEKIKKYSGKRLKSKLLEICNMPMIEQKKIMAQTYDEWTGINEQIDDMLLIGIRV